MRLNDVIQNLQKLAAKGHGEKQVFACHGASGAFDAVGHAFLENTVTDMGPFDLEPNEEYISLYIGN